MSGRIALRVLALVLLAAGALAPTGATAAEQLLVLEPAKTIVTFQLKATGHEVHGTLALESGQIRFDAETGAASGEVTVDARRAATGNDRRDRQMHGEVLETERFPLIVFRPDRVDGTLAAGVESDLALHGSVLIHGTEHELTLRAKVTVSGDRLTATATAAIPYVDWGLRDPSFLFLRVARVVTVIVKTEGRLRPVSRKAALRGERAELITRYDANIISLGRIRRPEGGPRRRRSTHRACATASGCEPAPARAKGSEPGPAAPAAHWYWRPGRPCSGVADRLGALEEVSVRSSRTPASRHHLE